MNKIIRPMAIVAMLGALSIPVVRAGPSNLNISAAQDFNLLTWQGATLSNSDVEGRAAVGGSMSFSSYSIGANAVIPNPLTGALIVGGNLTAGNGQVFNGSIYVGGSFSGPGYSLNSAPGSVTQSGLGSGVPFNFAAAETSLSATSLSYGGDAANGTSSLLFSTLTLTGTDSGLNIFDISAATLADASTLTIDAPAGSQVLINVSATSATFSNMGIDGTFTSDPNILYNFYQATTLNMSGIGIGGSILAPLANVDFQSGQLNGQLIANSFTGSGQLNLDTFNNQDPAPIPDAASSGALLLGVLIVGAASKRLRLSAHQQA